MTILKGQKKVFELDTNARHLPPTPSQQPLNKKMIDHLLTEHDAAPSLIRSFAKLQSSSPIVKPLLLNKLDRDNTPDAPSNFRSGSPPLFNTCQLLSTHSTLFVYIRNTFLIHHYFSKLIFYVYFLLYILYIVGIYLYIFNTS